MFVRYNATLRAAGARASSARGGPSGSATTLARSPSFASAGGPQTFTTSLHVTSSAIVKLGKLVKAEKVYRGVAGRRLPQQLIEANEWNVKGGIEVRRCPQPVKAACFRHSLCRAWIHKPLIPYGPRVTVRFHEYVATPTSGHGLRPYGRHRVRDSDGHVSHAVARSIILPCASS